VAKVYHADLYGTREVKYAALDGLDVKATDWQGLKSAPAFYLFVPRQEALAGEYERAHRITDIFPIHSVGIVTARDSLTIGWSADGVWERVRRFCSLAPEEAREEFQLGPDARDWKVDLAQEDMRDGGPRRDCVVPILYRPFDSRWTYYTGRSRGFHCMPRPEVMRNMLPGYNQGVHLCRQVVTLPWQHVLATDRLTDDCYVSNRTRERGYLFALYAYPDRDRPAAVAPMADWPLGEGGRLPNLAPVVVGEVAKGLKLDFISHGSGDPENTFGPEDFFHYIYAVLYSLAYRQRYAEFLKRDFPRIPFTSNPELFRKLCELGGGLVALHLLESPKVTEFVTSFPAAGENTVASGYARYLPPGRPDPEAKEKLSQGRVYVNRSQYFEGVPPEVWDFQIGGYQVCEKWLKDRRGRQLSYEDLTHYQKVIVALKETLRLMVEVDGAIEAHGGWPIR
jgi:hypothetical protein